jgi:hypothetical protein
MLQEARGSKFLQVGAGAVPLHLVMPRPISTEAEDGARGGIPWESDHRER